jgi:GT2 family glycosyltransferase
VIVFDQSEPHELDLPERPGRSVTCITNTRTPGLAGARNSGVVSTSAELVTFCDDDDEWLPGKLRMQVALLEQHPDSAVVATGIVVTYNGKDHERRAPDRPLTHRDFLRDRWMEVNPCTVVIRRRAMLEEIGLVDERIPGGYGEDYEWLLRASAASPIRSVPNPLVRVNWSQSSFFANRWRTIISALHYLLASHPDFEQEPAGLARIEGQIAFAHAGLGETATARSWARRALTHSPREPRAYVALLCSTGLVSNGTVMKLAHRAGRGI